MKRIIALSVLAVALPALFFVLAGCMKTPEHKPDFGPLASVDEVNLAIDELLVADPETMRVGEYVNYTVIQQIGTNTPKVAGQVSYTMTGREELSDRFKFTFVERVEDLSGDVPKYSDRSIELFLMKDTNTLSVKTPYKLSSVSDQFNKLSNKLGTHNKIMAEPTVTYHKLAKKSGFMPIPLAVKESENCGGLARCDQDLRTSTVSYDAVIWKEGVGERISFKFTVSPDVPYLSYKVSQCDQSYYSNGVGQTGVTVCREATSFRFGNN